MDDSRYRALNEKHFTLGIRKSEMKMKLSAILAVCTGILCAQEYLVPELQQAPPLNGKNSSAWNNASVLYGFYQRVPKTLEPRQGRTLFGYRGSSFYLRVETELPPDGTKLLASVRKHDGRIINDDGVEVWAAPLGSRKYYQYSINPFGTVQDIRHDRGGAVPEESWTAGWKKSVFFDSVSKVWVFETAIPLKDMGIAGDPAGKKISLLVSRNWKRPWEQTPFIRNEAPFSNLSRYAVFTLSPEAPTIRIDSLGELEKQMFDLKGTIRNNAKKLRTFRLSLHFSHGDMPETQESKDLTLKPGEELPFVFHDDAGRIHLRTSHQADFTVESDGKVIYRAEYAYKLPMGSENRWKIVKGISSGFQFAIYPGRKKAGIRFDAGKDASRAAVEFRRDGKIVFLKELTPLHQENQFFFDIPELAAGKYTVTLALWNNEKKLSSSSREFVRQVFPWENNTLGISDEVYPPFRKISVSGNRLETVLCKYAFDGTGLFSEVNPEGIPLLKDKLSFHFTADGKPGLFTKAEGKFHKKSGSECVFLGTAETDAGFCVKTSARTEYDGCTRFEMTLVPKPGKTPVLNEFHMDIPLDSSQIRLFHIIKSSSIRTNPAIRVPAGEGVVWKSTDVSNGDFYGNMHIYLWLGEMARGLAWFADNDRNFSVDDKQPVQELIRRNGTLTLRVHFVNLPFRLESPRTIVFGMQASPVKPMPADWRNPNLIIPPHGGSNAYWGIRPAYSGKYPDGYDWQYVDEMVRARETGKINTAYLDDFLKRHYGNLPESERKGYRVHAYGGHGGMMAQRGDQPTMLYLEEHAQDQTTPEWNTFQDEWGLVQFTPRKWLEISDLNTPGLRSAAGIGITPVKSYQDFVMWQCREWLRRGIGLYCDNTFPRSSTDLVNSSAYVRPDGSVQPSSDIWDMREYHKRMWVLTRQMQKSVKWPLLISLHITNGMILPIACWTDVELDLEWGWANGYKPFPPELLEIETTARQIGAYPQAHFPIAGCGLVHENPTYLSGKVNQDMVRTDWAMRMIYGVLRYNMRGENFTPFNKIVNDFGLGTPSCKVYDYWQRDYPVKIMPDEVKSILLRRENRAILIIASWADKPIDVKISFGKSMKIKSASGKFPEKTFSVSENAFQCELQKYGMQLFLLELERP